MALPHGAVCWSAKWECGISWSYSLFEFDEGKSTTKRIISKKVKKPLPHRGFGEKQGHFFIITREQMPYFERDRGRTTGYPVL